MKRILFTALLLAALPASGGITFVTDPFGGGLSGTPGLTTGWGFTFTADDNNFYVLTGVEFCASGLTPPNCTANSSGIGTFTDFAAAVNALIIGPGYSVSPYSETFDNSLQTGLGSFQIDPAASEQLLQGTLYVFYDVYDADPVGGGSAIFTGLNMTNTASIAVVPEPGSWALLAAGIAALALGGRRRRLRAGR